MSAKSQDESAFDFFRHNANEAINYLGWTKRQAAKVAGFSEKHLGDVLLGRANPSGPFVAALAKAVGVSAAALMLPDFSMEAQSTKSVTADTPQPVPYYKVIGEPDGARVVKITQSHLYFRQDWLFHKGDTEDLGLHRVSSNSMAPLISKGDVILVNHADRECAPGHIMLVYLPERDAVFTGAIEKGDGELFFSRDLVCPQSEEMLSLPYSFPPEKVEETGQVSEAAHVIGRVLWVSKDLS